MNLAGLAIADLIAEVAVEKPVEGLLQRALQRMGHLLAVLILVQQRTQFVRATAKLSESDHAKFTRNGLKRRQIARAQDSEWCLRCLRTDV